MVKRLNQILKNQKGLTLVELLAVIVILGIIAAIAVPSIGHIIDNSKKDAHVANAQQMIAAARMAVASNDQTKLTATTTILADDKLTLEELIKSGYIESEFLDPDTGKAYLNPSTDSFVEIDKSTTQNEVTTTDAYTVTLIGADRSITGVPADKLNRDSVKDNS